MVLVVVVGFSVYNAGLVRYDEIRYDGRSEVTTEMWPQI